MQTASQIMAAKKQEKQKKQAAKQKRDTKPDRNRNAKIDFQQHKNRQELRNGEPRNEEAQLNYAVYLHIHLNALAYGNDRFSLIAAEQTIRHMRCVAAIYADAKLSAFTNAAQKAVEAIHRGELDNASPNQRREHLRPLKMLYEHAEAYAAVIPATTAVLIEDYQCAVEAVLYYSSYREQPQAHRDALNQIINGAKISDLARQYQARPSEIRACVLDTAWLLYRTVSALLWERNAERIGFPQNITALKKPCWRPFADPDGLDFWFDQTTRRSFHPFITATGIELIPKTDYCRTVPLNGGKQRLH